ncbi:MAG: glucose-1-phosphate adenylyltransferase subunit GlgD [Clostridiales bacterium]|nr:glucose-1-phosphate adenylyltransferase subunit GlgD [Clostridiales bacterium]
MKAIGIILAGGNSDRLGDLCKERAIAAVPVGGSYRAIDFSLSNMTNSGINKVAVITQYNLRSLQDHLSASKWWDFGSKKGGLFIFSPFIGPNDDNWYRGTADSIYQNISFLKKSNEPYVVIASGDAVYKMDFNDIVNYHEAKGADITIAYKDLAGTSKKPELYGIIGMDADGRIVDFEEKPEKPKGTTASMGIYVIKRDLLIDLLEKKIAEGKYNLVKDIIKPGRHTLKVYGFEYKPYWVTLNTTKAYYDANMKFLNADTRDLLLSEPYIYTKPKDDPPVKYNVTAKVKNSLISGGTIIDGTIEDSVVFRKVYVSENSSVKNSIILESTHIGKNCTIQYAILDKEVVISDGKSIIGTPDAPAVVAKGTVI